MRALCLTLIALIALGLACAPPSPKRCCQCLASSARDVDNSTGVSVGGPGSCLSNQRSSTCEDLAERGVEIETSDVCLNDFCGDACDGLSGFVVED